MVQATTHGGAREACAVTVTARPLARDAGGSERFWAAHVGVATAASMLAPIVTALALGSRSAPRPASDALGGESHVAVSRGPAPPKSGVEGRILDPEGLPVFRASVRVVAVGDALHTGAAVTDADGRFHVAGFAAGAFRVIAEDSRDGVVESERLDAQSVHGLVLVLARAGSIRGVVLDERRVPIPHANVKSWGGSAATEKVATADDEGRYAIERPGPGADRITVWARGFDPSTRLVSRAVSAESAVDLVLRASRPIRGHVTGPTGRPVAGARITACQRGSEEAAISDGEGRFELPATTIGCEASALHPRFSAARPTMIEGGREIIVRLSTGGAIEGRVVDARGAPVNSFSVTIDSFAVAAGESPRASRAGETRDELRGAFRFDDLAAGTYVVRAVTADGLSSEPETIEIGRGKVVHGVGLVLAGIPGAEASADSSSDGAEP